MAGNAWPQGTCAPVFVCSTAKGKQISVCDAGNAIEYTFGTPGHPAELALHTARSHVVPAHDNGIGRYRNFSLGFPNGRTVYTVYYDFDTAAPDDPPVAGVHVTSGTQTLVDVPCRDSKSMVMKLDTLDFFYARP
jgi:hypothetical protein